MDYGYALTRAWQITWKYKVLWIFGILAGCSSNSNSGNADFSWDYNETPPEFVEFGDKALSFLSQPAVIIALILFIILLILLSIFLNTIGRIGLISGTYKAEMGAEKLGFGELFKDGTSRFWSFFGMNFFVNLPFIIIIIGILGAGVFAAISAENMSGAEDFLIGFIPTICVLFCCLFFLALFLGILVQQAQNAMIIEERGILASLMRGWEVFKSNLGHVLLMAVILFIISIVVGVIIALPILIILIPAAISFFVDGARSMQPLILMGLCMVAYFPVLLVLSGILTTYTQAVWTLIYLQLTNQTLENQEEDIIANYA